jgi:hypothetical protein
MVKSSLIVIFSFMFVVPLRGANIPPDSDNAKKAIADSPRHGEWVDVPLPGSDVKLNCWVATQEAWPTTIAFLKKNLEETK